MKAEVIVDDDQLSLSIGKHGQNVRLASRLVGWELDIRTKSMIAAEALGGSEENKAAPQAEEGAAEKEGSKAKKETKKESKKESRKPAKSEAAPSLEDLPGVGDKTLESLKDAGVKSIGDILEMEEEGLMKIKGIGEKKAQKILAEAKKLA